MFTCTLQGLKIPKRKGGHYEGCKPANPIKQPKIGFTLNSREQILIWKQFSNG